MQFWLSFDWYLKFLHGTFHFISFHGWEGGSRVQCKQLHSNTVRKGGIDSFCDNQSIVNENFQDTADMDNETWHMKAEILLRVRNVQWCVVRECYV